MRKIIILMITLTLVLFSCGQDSKSSPFSIEKGASKYPENIENQSPVTKSNDKYIDTKYEYSDSNAQNLIIENSVPKGGLKLTATNGKEYVYAIFWTKITNETDNPFTFKLDFPADSLKLPSSPDNYFKIFLPSEKMTIDKAPLFNYGLKDLSATLDNKFQNSSSLQRTISSNETSFFYVLTLFKKGVKGTVRAGIDLKDDQLYYRVNDKMINIGQFNNELLKLQN